MSVIHSEICAIVLYLEDRGPFGVPWDDLVEWKREYWLRRAALSADDEHEARDDPEHDQHGH